VLSGLIIADLTLQQGRTLLFLARELFELVDYLIFWR
jgi:hypothetical protein